MNSRRVLIMIGIILLLVIMYLFFLHAGNQPLVTSADGTPSTPVSTPLASATPQTTASPTVRSAWESALRPQDVTKAAGQFDATWVGAIVAVGKVMLAILVGLVALYLSAVFIDAILFSPRQLVITDIVNASGDKDLDSILPGLSQRMREQLREEMEWLERIAGWFGSQQAPGADFAAKFPAPDEKVVAEIPNFVKSMSEVGSDRVEKLMKLVSFLFRQRGTRAGATLQVIERASGKIGLTVQMNDIAGGAIVAIKTFSETQYRALGDPVRVLPPCASPASNSSTTPAPLGVPRSQDITALWPYRDILMDIAKALTSAGLIADAIEFLKEAMAIDPSRANEVAAVLADSDAKLRTQWEAKTALDLGRKLEEAKLSREAIEVFVRPLPHTFRLIASKEWPTALGIKPGDKAEAYTRLATVYRWVFLNDEARELYRRALDISPGNRLIQTRLDRLHRRQARALAEAAGWLCTIDRFFEAEKYVKLGVIWDPNNIQAAHVFDRVKQHKAAEAASKPDGALLDRFAELSKPALRWQALELFKQEMVARRPKGLLEEDRNHYDAKIYNFLGALCLASSVSPGGKLHELFFNCAYTYLTRALDLWDDWFIPYENLGDYFRVRGLYGETSPAQERFVRADLFYEMARQKLEPILLLGKASIADSLRIRAEQASARVLSGSPELKQKVRKTIIDLEKDLEKELKENRDEWSRSASFLYEMSTLYALSVRYELGVPKAADESFRYLAYSLARDGRRDRSKRLFWSWAQQDEILQCVRSRMPRLKEELENELTQYPDLPTLGLETERPHVRSFFDHVDAAIRRADWSKEDCNGQRS